MIRCASTCLGAIYESNRSLSLRVFRLLSSSVLLFPQRFGRRTYRPKRCGNNTKDEDNSPKTLNDKNHQASSQKFKQLK